MRQLFKYWLYAFLHNWAFCIIFPISTVKLKFRAIFRVAPCRLFCSIDYIGELSFSVCLGDSVALQGRASD